MRMFETISDGHNSDNYNNVHHMISIRRNKINKVPITFIHLQTNVSSIMQLAFKVHLSQHFLFSHQYFSHVPPIS